MIDRVKIFAKAGDGGHGCSSFHRSRHDHLGRPDGAFSILYNLYQPLQLCWLLHEAQISSILLMFLFCSRKCAITNTIIRLMLRILIGANWS